ncbi:MAG: hypothetical protein R2810_16310 [Flavobacteriales bacterium]|nr:hypothetical protein [Flavobacteriales bacterium]MCB9181482.1 hypothetical protein [Flavobacteriales bacterium]MCB9200174.1 hypothetical protein [Flavobacteriales bacterium]HPF67218.1 hypothetical protein [Flavobacteriales bacterium]HPJ53057.1 hypothetical protein [Flavobacteriales bacterium]
MVIISTDVKNRRRRFLRKANDLLFQGHVNTLVAYLVRGVKELEEGTRQRHGHVA